jgi:hypothetical protein
MESEDIFLIAGATGRCGVWIVRALLEKGRKVRLLIRNKEKLSQFTEDERSHFESVVYCNLVHDTDYKQKLADALKGQVRYVISALAHNSGGSQSSEQGNFVTNSRLIDAVKEKTQIKRFLLLSSSHVTKPWSCFALCGNIFRSYNLYYKARTEEYLRTSGINYLIVRPTTLRVADKPSAYTLSQGDKIEGQITIPTVGKLIADTILDQWVPKNSTYECISTTEQLKEPYKYVFHFEGHGKLNTDTDKDKQLVVESEKVHLKATRIVKWGSMVVIISTVFGIVFMTSKDFAKGVKNFLGRK